MEKILNTSLATLNLKFWKEEIIMEIQRHKIDICVISEINKRGKEIEQIQNCILMYNKEYNNNMNNITSQIELDLWLSKSERKWDIISVNALDTCRIKEGRTKFYNEL